nr:hypothetical protein [Tanacetum cinerariifolium]
MSTIANTTLIVTTVTKPATNPGREKTPRDADATPRVNIQDFCKEYYEDILLIIMDKIRHDKQKEVHARLDFREGSRERRIREGSHYSSVRTLSATYHNQSKRLKVQDRLRYNDRHVLDRLGQAPGIVLAIEAALTGGTLLIEIVFRVENAPMTSENHMTTPIPPMGPTTDIAIATETARRMKRGRDSESPLSRVSENDSSDGGHLKSKSKRHKPTDKDDLTMLWICEEVDPFIPRIREATAAGKKKGHTSWRTQDRSKRHTLEKRSEFRGQPREGRGSSREIAFPSLATSSGTEGPLVIEAEFGGHMIHRMHVDGGSSTEVLYEYYFNWLWPKVKNQWSLSSYNGIIERPRIKEIQAVPSTAHGMLKFLADRGIVTICSTILIPAECATVIIVSKEIPKEAGVRHENFKVALHPNFPDMTGVQRSVAEHRLNIREGYSPVWPKKRDQALKRAKAIQAEIQLARSDEEKTAFHIGQWVYCYTKMPQERKRHVLAAGGQSLRQPNWLEHKSVMVKILKEKVIQEKEVTTVVEEDGPTWMTLIIEYLKEANLPGDKKEARKLRIKARQYELLEGVFYRRSFFTSWLRCVEPLQADYVIREIHKGSCSMHAGPRSMPLTLITTPWSFYKWGINIADPFLKGPGETVSDNGKQFSDNPFKDWCDKLNITQRFALVKHSQSNGLIERANRSLGEGIKAHMAVIPAEIGMPTYRTAAVDVIHNNEKLRLNLDLLEERRERAAIRKAKAKLKMTKYYNARVRGVTFRPGDFVFRSNDVSHAMGGGKLGPKWEGPYEVTEELGDGAYKLRFADGTILPRTWNVANLKKCYL